MAAEGGSKGGTGGIISRTMRIAAPVAILMAVALKFGIVAAGQSAPDFLRPTPPKA